MENRGRHKKVLSGEYIGIVLVVLAAILEWALVGICMALDLNRDFSMMISIVPVSMYGIGFLCITEGVNPFSKWTRLGFERGDAQTWRDAGFKPYDAWSWLTSGFGPGDARKWADAGLCNFIGDQEWRYAKFEPVEAKEWRNWKFEPSDALKWKIIGVDPNVARKQADDGVDPSSLI